MIRTSRDRLGKHFVIWKNLTSRDGMVSAVVFFEWLELIEAACACNYWRSRDGREWIEHTGH